jgi:hypothetical protein
MVPQTAIEKKACNALLLKVNQIGTLTESIQAYAAHCPRQRERERRTREYTGKHTETADPPAHSDRYAGCMCVSLSVSLSLCLSVSYCPSLAVGMCACGCL